jgi:DNA-binding CsgD family transcriptional regulator
MLMRNDLFNALVAEVYEAAIVIDRWPKLLQALADFYGARGAMIFSAVEGLRECMVTEGFAETFDRFVREGHMEPNLRAAPLIAEHPPCFRRNGHYRSAAERALMPVYRDLLTPAGFEHAVGTVVQGPHDALIAVTLEGLPTQAAAERTLPSLDRLRPHLARALGLSVHVGLTRARTIVESLSLAGCPAATIDKQGKLLSANDAFHSAVGGRAVETRQRLRLRDVLADRQLRDALTTASSAGAQTSFVIPRHEDEKPCVVHVIPLVRMARDVFGSEGFVLMNAKGENRTTPGADLLRVMFDLTTREATLARLIVEGQTVTSAAATMGITLNTAKVHLRRVLEKTGCGRQVDLVALISEYRTPVIIS